MNEERTGKCLRQEEHIRGHLLHRYSITVNPVVVAIVQTFEVMNNVHQPNRFAHKQIIWYDCLCPLKKRK